jgi:Cytochrome c554 and c-prime
MTRQRHILVTLVGSIAVAGFAAMTHAEPAAPAASAASTRSDLPLESQRRIAAKDGTYQGIGNCLLCHTPGLSDKKSVFDHVLLTEAAIWKTKDNHHLAYESLLSDLGQRIGARLHAKVLEPATGCIQCHTAPGAMDRAAADPKNLPVMGVDCEACHGPAKKWVGEHQNHDTWYATKDKAKLGFIDVRSADARAELCLSCHVGSPADDRVITHAMYAAGHPPLPGFEIESFAGIEPRHWRYPDEKPTHEGPAFKRTQNVLTASVVALRTSIEMADYDASAANQRDHWPEFARLDCYVCHHAVDETDWRRRQTGAFPLGRPRLQLGCLPLVSIAARLADDAEARKTLETATQQLQAPFEISAFGDPGEISARVPSIVDACRTLEQQLSSTPPTSQTAREVLHAIAQEAAARDCDYDTARQLFGAWVIVFRELVANDKLQADSTVKDGITSVNKSFHLKDKNPAEFVASKLQSQSIADAPPDLSIDRIQHDPEEFAREMAKLDAQIKSSEAEDTPAGAGQ